MPSLTTEQLVNHIKSLETKIKQYQQAIKLRDVEILRLRNELKTAAGKKPCSPTSSPEAISKPLPASISPDSKTLPLQDVSVEEEIREKTTEIPSPTLFVPSIHFQAGEFLSAVLEGEEESEEIKSLLERLTSGAPDERRNGFLSLSSVYWRMTAKMAKRLATENLSWEKRLCMRFGMLDDQLMANRMDVWEQLYSDKSRPKDTGIYYIDEWYEAILRGELRYSSIDEMALGGSKPDPRAVGAQSLAYEILTVPQMQRMCVGPRANMITILAHDFCSPNRDNPIIDRQWLPKAMAKILPCDFQMFHRKYKGKESIVKPLFLICPGYGQRSGCWEPYSPGKKGETGPRIPLCAFPPRSSSRALIVGLSEYRWEYAKADAMHYWLTEGLTGKWIALFNKKEQRKDLKAWFQECYWLWIAYEANRIPKLEKRFRDFFWINCPFSDEIKLQLKGGGMFGHLIELEEAKKAREEEERLEIERIKAERDARKAKRMAEWNQLP